MTYVDPSSLTFADLQQRVVELAQREIVLADIPFQQIKHRLEQEAAPNSIDSNMVNGPDPQELTGYLNGWRHYAGTGGQPYSPAVYYKHAGIVHLEGLVDKNGGNYVAFETIAVLPSEYAPAREVIFQVAAAGGAAFGSAQVRVKRTGVIQIGDVGGPASPVVFVSLAGIHFRTP